MTKIHSSHSDTNGTQALTRCKDCPHGFAKLVGSSGDPESPVVIVGESPGKEEVKLGVPFVGSSGKVLAHALAQHPDIKQPYMLNAFQCYPGSSNVKSIDRVAAAARCCQPRLYDAIKSHPRAVIIALGNAAVWSTTGEFGYKITQIRGRLFSSQLSARGIVATVHPAFLLRGGGSLRQFMGDIDYALRLAKGGETKRYIVPQVHVAKSVDNVKWLASQIAQHPYCASDIETGGYQGFDHLRDRILCVGFSFDPSSVYVLPEHLVRYSEHIFNTARDTRFVWHNGKFDQKFFWAKDVPSCRVDEDTMLLSYALDETKGIHDLEQISQDLLGAPDWKFMIKDYKGKGKTYADIPTPILHDYMAKDISGTLQIFQILRGWVKNDPLTERLYTQTLMPTSKYLARIEMQGMQPDLAQVEKNAEEKTALAVELEREFNQHAIDAGLGALNPRSPQQVGNFLYDVLKLRDPRKPKKRPDSTDEDTLVSLQSHPAVKTLLKYREVQKGLSTYVNSIPEHVGADGRIHCTYLIHGTSTGRLASRNPNLLNIPREPSLRGQFIARPGYLLLEIDVNQAELRVLAELSRDPELIYIYTTPGAPSIHKVTQTSMFGDPKTYDNDMWQVFEEKFSTQGDRERTLEEQNMRAKCVNFGIVYGRTAPSIAEEFKMPVLEAQEWINAWFKKYATAREFILSCRSAPIRGANLITPFGRKRRFQIVSPERLNDIQNQAANFPEQSIASDCVMHTGMAVQEFAYRDYGALIVNTVYDSLIFECPIDPPEKVYELGARVLKVLSEMPRKWGLSLIPFKGDLKIGTRWGHTKKTPIPKDIAEKWGV